MSSNEFHDIIIEYLEKKRKGMDYTQIRKELRNKEITDNDIKKIIQEIDDKILEDEFEKTQTGSRNKMQIMGWLFTAIGVIFILGRHTNITFFYDNYLLSYGSLIVGLTLLFYGYIKKRKSIIKKDESSNIFKQER